MDLPTLLRTPYVLGGREVGVAIDCLGVANYIATERGIPAPDGWPSIRAAWERGELDLSGLPPGWHKIRVAEPYVPRDGDLLVYFGQHPWCAIVHRGRVFGAAVTSGVYAIPAYRWKRKPDQVWRWQQ